MMKAIISLLLALTALKAQTLPTVKTGALATSKCMSVAAGANSTTNATCTSCFTWGTATMAYDSSAILKCGTAISTGAITNCQIYGYQASNTVDTSVPNASTCKKCEKKYYNVVQAISGGNMLGTCADTKGTGCTDQIKNCYQTVCYSKFSSNTAYSSQFCKICKSGYIPAELDIWDQGA